MKVMLLSSLRYTHNVVRTTQYNIIFDFNRRTRACANRSGPLFSCHVLMRFGCSTRSLRLNHDACRLSPRPLFARVVLHRRSIFVHSFLQGACKPTTVETWYLLSLSLPVASLYIPTSTRADIPLGSARHCSSTFLSGARSFSLPRPKHSHSLLSSTALTLNMGDSDYEFDGDDGSDEEYVGSRDSSTSRAQTVSKRKSQPKVPERKAHAWARRGSTPPEEEFEYIPAEEEEEEEDTTPQKSLQQIEEERKRKRYVTRCGRLAGVILRAGQC
jgi:hypothetical protein